MYLCMFGCMYSGGKGEGGRAQKKNSRIRMRMKARRKLKAECKTLADFHPAIVFYTKEEGFGIFMLMMKKIFLALLR